MMGEDEEESAETEKDPSIIQEPGRKSRVYGAWNSVSGGESNRPCRILLQSKTKTESSSLDFTMGELGKKCWWKSGCESIKKKEEQKMCRRQI